MASEDCKQMSMAKGTHTPKVRDERIDSVKYWLIVLVIAGHVFSREEFWGIRECVFVWKWIYLFHMPLFVFVSGYFSRKKDGKALKASIWKIMEPLIIFQAIKIMPKLISASTDDYLSIILTPGYTLWFLLSLIYWRLLLQIIPDRLLNNTKLIIFCTFFISIVAGFFPFGRILSIQRTLSFMPFFFLGYCMKDKKLFLPDRYKPLSFMFLVLMVAIPWFFPNWLGDLNQAEPYDFYYGAFQRLFVFSLSIPMSLAFMNLCINTPWIAKQGQLTMQYYIYHSFAIAPLLAVGGKLGIQPSFFSATIYTLVIIIGIGFALYLPIFRKLTNPSSFLKNDAKKE